MVRRWLGVSATLVALGTCFAAGRMVAAKERRGAAADRAIHPRRTADRQRVGQSAHGEARRAMEMARKEHARLLLVFQFDAGKNQKEFGRGSDFGEAYQFGQFPFQRRTEPRRTTWWPICRSRSRGTPCCR